MKRIVVLFPLVLMLTLLVVSCSDNLKLNEREKSLFVQSYHSIPIVIENNNNLGNLLAQLDSIYCSNADQAEQMPWPLAYFDLKKRQWSADSNQNTIAIGIDPNPCFKGMYDDKMILEIIKEHHNLKIENEFTEVDSIPSYVKKQLLSNGSDPNYSPGAFGNGIWICSQKVTTFEELNPILYQSILGFVSSAREFSKMTFKKEIQDLNDQEFAALQSEYVFHLSFHYTDIDPVIQIGYNR